MKNPVMKCHLRPTKVAIFCLCLLFANVCLQWLVDSDLGLGWPHVCIRNWHQFGFLSLKGQMVANPGGHDALLHPEIQPGHRAASLYLPFLISCVFSWTGSNALAFHALLSLLVVLSVWRLLGGSDAALFVGALAVLSAGYVLEPTVLDPNAIAELLGIPYATLLWWCLRQPQFTFGNFGLVLLATTLFSALNWTTVLTHAQILAALIALRSVPTRRLVLYVTCAAASGLLVLVISVLSRASADPHRPGAFLEFLAGYTWGRSGYGYDTGSLTLLLRFAFVNAVALLPFWLLLSSSWWRSISFQSARTLWSLAPLMVTFVEVLALRNYFCHHPWMGAPYILVGAILTLLVLRFPIPTGIFPGIITIRTKVQAIAGLAGVFCFSFAVLFFYREHNQSILSLTSLIRASTARSSLIAMSSAQDPRAHHFAYLLPELLDRDVVLIKTAPDSHQPVPADFFLSPVPLGGAWKLIGQTSSDPLASMPWLSRSRQWYMNTIARRKPEEWLIVPETYYLYRVPQKSGAAMVLQSSP